jgi:hypothetical protein
MNLAGNYTTTLEASAKELTEMTAEKMNLEEPTSPPNDPLVNPAKQTVGLYQNAYQHNSKSFPDTEINTYKGSAIFHNCSSPEEYAEKTKEVVNFALDRELEKTPYDSWNTEDKWGAIMTVVEKFAWKAGIVEDAVSEKLAELEDTNVRTQFVTDLPELEPMAWDIVVTEVSSGETFGVSVKTNCSNPGNKDEDYLANVKADLDDREIMFNIEKI